MRSTATEFPTIVDQNKLHRYRAVAGFWNQLIRTAAQQPLDGITAPQRNMVIQHPHQTRVEKAPVGPRSSFGPRRVGCKSSISSVGCSSVEKDCNPTEEISFTTSARRQSKRSSSKRGAVVAVAGVTI